MVGIAETGPHDVESVGVTFAARERQDFHVFVALLILIQVLWLTAVGFGVYALVT